MVSAGKTQEKFSEKRYAFQLKNCRQTLKNAMLSNPKTRCN